MVSISFPAAQYYLVLSPLLTYLRVPCQCVRRAHTLFEAKRDVLSNLAQAYNLIDAAAAPTPAMLALHDVLATVVADGAQLTQQGIKESFAAMPVAVRSLREDSLVFNERVEEGLDKVAALSAALQRFSAIFWRDTAEKLSMVSSWGSAMRRLHCQLSKMPALGQRVSLLHDDTLHRVLHSMARFGRQEQNALAARRSGTMLKAPQHTSCSSDLLAAQEIISSGFVDDEEVHRARAVFAVFDEVCPPIQHVLLRLVDTPAASAPDFLSAIGAKRFAKAAEALERYEPCLTMQEPWSANAFDCGDATQSLRMGCAVGPRWIEAPGDKLTSVAVTATAASSEIIAERAVPWSRVTVHFNALLQFSARAACSTNEEAHVNISASTSIAITFFAKEGADPDVSMIDVSAVARAIRILPDGAVELRPGPDMQEWWVDFTPVYFNVGPVHDARGWLNDVCSRAAGARRAVVSIDIGTISGLFSQSATPFFKTLLVSGLEQRPSAFHIAPMASCEASCPDGLSSRASGQLEAHLPLFSPDLQPFSLPAEMVDCLQTLSRDYATCDVDKITADRRFAACARLPQPATSVDLIVTIINSALSTNATRALLAELNCRSYTALKSQYCVCSPGSGERDPRSSMAIHTAIDFSGDAATLKHIQPLRTLQQRLLSLGYGRSMLLTKLPNLPCELKLDTTAATSSPTQESGHGAFMSVDFQAHLTRVFLCASAGVYAFEDLCEISEGSRCLVAGDECPAGAKTPRLTCLRPNTPCAFAAILPDTVEHAQLTSREAPNWVMLAPQGIGFRREPATDAVAFGTTWLADALTIAGRHYHSIFLSNHSMAEPLRVAMASSREGGVIHGQMSHQTGLQLRFILPLNEVGDVDWEAARAQVTCLEMAGFVNLKLKGKGELTTCEWKPSLCIGAGVKVGELSAEIQAPSASSLESLPTINASALQLALDGQSAELHVLGHNLGASLADVVRVQVGVDFCIPQSIASTGNLQRITAMCGSSDKSRWIHGLASVTIVGGGTGVGTQHLAAFVVVNSSSALSLAEQSNASALAVARMEHAISLRLLRSGPNPAVPSGLVKFEAYRARLFGASAQCGLSDHVTSCVIENATHQEVGNAPRKVHARLMAPMPINRTFSFITPVERATFQNGPSNQSCAGNEAWQLYANCSAAFPRLFTGYAGAHLVQGALPYVNVSNWAEHTLFTPDTINCQSQDSFSGFVDLPMETGEQTVSLSVRKASGLVSTLGPANATYAFGISGAVLLELTTVVVGARATCIGSGAAISYHAYASLWLPPADLHTFVSYSLMLSELQPPLLERFSALTTLVDVRAHIVQHSSGAIADATDRSELVASSRGADPDEARIPKPFRGLRAGMHIHARAGLSDRAGNYVCLVAWLILGSHPCTMHDVPVRVFIPTFSFQQLPANERIDAILANSSLTVDFPAQGNLINALISSVGASRITMEDLRAPQFTTYGDPSTRRPGLEVGRLTMHLPTRADSLLRGLRGPRLSFGPAVAETVEDHLSMQELQALAQHLPGQSRTLSSAPYVRKYARLVQAGSSSGEGPLSGASWRKPLGIDATVQNVRADVSYTVTHPLKAFVGPTLRVFGAVVLSDGHQITVGVQLDPGYSNEANDRSVDKPAQLLCFGGQGAVTHVMEVYLRITLMGSSRRSAIMNTLPRELEATNGRFTTCLSESDVLIDGPANEVIGRGEFAAGFHGDLRGFLWGAPVQAHATASLGIEQAAHFQLTPVLVTITFDSPNDVLDPMLTGAALALESTTFLAGCNLSSVVGTLTSDPHSQDSAGASMTIETRGSWAYGDLLIRLSFSTMMSNSSSATPTVVSNLQDYSRRVATEWFDGVALQYETQGHTSSSLRKILLTAMDVSTPKGASFNPIPYTLAYITADDARVCFVGSGQAHLSGCPQKGVHSKMRLSASSGLFGMEATAHITSATLNSSAEATLLMSLTVNLVADQLSILWPFVRQGLLDGVPFEMVEGLNAYLGNFELAEAEITYASAGDPEAGGSHLRLLLYSPVFCHEHAINIPLSKFDEFVAVDQHLSKARLQQVCSLCLVHCVHVHSVCVEAFPRVLRRTS